MRLEALEVKTQWDEWLVLSGSQPIPLHPLHHAPPQFPLQALSPQGRDKGRALWGGGK